MAIGLFRTVAVFIVVTVAWSAGDGRCGELHVTLDGSKQGSGTNAEPWDLATALAATQTVKPGDTVWLHEGTYRGGFVSRLSGRPGMPVVVRGVKAGRVTIDTQPRDPKDSGALLLLGADCVYRDFEVTCSHPLRETRIAGSWPADIRRGNVDVRGDRISAINLVVHDCANGFGLWADGEGGEISGCLIYNNGWRGPDRGHGHAIYAQNARGTKRLVDNVVFNQFAYGIHVYGSEKASLAGFEINGNIAFENGCLTRKGDNSAGIMVGGGSPVKRLAVRDNVLVGGALQLGYSWSVTNDDVVCTGNYCGQGLMLRGFRQGTIAKNTIVAESKVAQLEGAGKLSLDGLQWNDNDYYVTDGRWGEFAVAEGRKSRALTFDEWRALTGFDVQSRFTKGTPSKLLVTVRPNAYEPGRAHVAVVNPQELPEVEVDLSKVLSPGRKFRIVSVKDFFGPALVAGDYDGQSVRVPMKPVAPPAPVGLTGVEIPVTEPRFAAFVVMPEPDNTPLR